MEIFQSISNIISNNKQFEQWEQENKNRNIQRAVLQSLNPPSDSELKDAKSRGKILIDVVDIMDRRSEDVAQNVEGVTSLPKMLLPLASLIGSIPLSFKFLIAPNFDKFNKLLEAAKLENGAQIDGLANTLAQNLKENNAHLTDEQLNALAKSKINNATMPILGKFFEEDALKNIPQGAKEEFSTNLKQVSKNILNATKKPLSKTAFGVILPVLAGGSALIGSLILSFKLQLEATRVARWQARNELENPKYFVKYTDEQIENAKNKLKTAPDIKKYDGDKSSLADVIRDNRAYNAWRKNDVDESKFGQNVLNLDEFKEAERDKEYIQRVTKEINNKAEEYSENMGTLANATFAATPILGLLIGQPVAFLVEKTGLGKKIASALNANLINSIKTPEKKEIASNILENVAKIDAQKGSMLDKFDDLSSSIKKMIEMDFDPNKNMAEQIFEGVKKGVNVVGATKFGRHKIALALAFIPTAIFGITTTLKLQKSSSRVGRFVAKRELEKDPNNFIGYNEDDYKTVDFIKNEKDSALKKVLNYLTFTPRVLGEYASYKHFTNHEGKENVMLLNELVKADVTEAQLKDAKNLQRKIFNTFEKIDDNSQKYSEALETAVAIAQPTVWYAGIASAILVPVAILLSRRGKLDGGAMVQNISKFIDKHPEIMENKFVAKYFSDVKKNSDIVFKKQDIESEAAVKANEILKNVLADIKSKDDFANMAQKLKALPDEELNLILKEAKLDGILKPDVLFKALSNIENVSKNLNSAEIDRIINTVLEKLKENPAKFIKIATNAKALQEMFITADVKNAALVLGAGWFATNFAVTFIVEAYLAELQKKAGRLGVMKALDELQDARYYANAN